MKARWFVFVITVIALLVLIFVRRASNPPYAVEIRRVGADGTVTYEAQQYRDWNHEANIAGLRKHTSDVIYHSVYFDGLQYCFAKSGHVYALAGSENDLPSRFGKEWNWSGDPHQFPHFDYSHASPLVRP